MSSAFQLPIITHFPEPYGEANILAGARRQLLQEIRVPRGNVGFVQRISNAYWMGDSLTFSIDGRPIEPKIERAIGTFANPMEVIPWFRMPVREKVVWEVTNNDTLDHQYEVSSVGFYVKEEELPLLFKLTGVNFP